MTIALKGGPQLAEFLAAFPQRLQTGAVRAGLVAAAKPIRDQARVLAPKKTGAMARSIKTGSPRKNENGTFSISIRLKGQNSYLGLFHEYGVAAHIVNVSDADRPTYTTRSGVVRQRSIRFIDQQVKRGSLKIGQNFVGPVVMHPGHGARPFMRPALDAKAQEAIVAFGARIREYLSGKTGFTGPTLELDEAA